MVHISSSMTEIQPFNALTPDLVLTAVESTGLPCDGAGCKLAAGRQAARRLEERVILRLRAPQVQRVRHRHRLRVQLRARGASAQPRRCDLFVAAATRTSLM